MSKKNNSGRLTVKPDFNFDLNTELSDVLKNDQEIRSALQDLIQNLSKDVVKKNDGQQTTINLDNIDSKLLVNILQSVLNARLEKRLCDIEERLKQVERDIADAGKRIHLNSVNSIDAISHQTQIQNPAQIDSTSSQLG
ncbi:unnamed protein product [Didymodactylos carnosus]|uniref:Uncharacterized protein n=1 Tax=Didymodactylos carnosus TaxID=1234261 RepID=A0A815QTE3_9BILA|nr:unnamed protein product [Didymodactylos carnosus]CAF4336590.1 unnamed protein product [Didymodactylos carnosus]